MGKELQDVQLYGGSFDGQMLRAAPWPNSLALAVRLNGQMWTEHYAYDGPTAGGLPVMRYVEHGPVGVDDWPTHDWAPQAAPAMKAETT